MMNEDRTLLQKFLIDWLEWSKTFVADEFTMGTKNFLDDMIDDKWYEDLDPTHPVIVNHRYSPRVGLCASFVRFLVTEELKEMGENITSVQALRHCSRNSDATDRGVRMKYDNVRYRMSVADGRSSTILGQLFEDQGLDTVYPFGSDYSNKANTATQHQCALRINWVLQMIEEGGAQ